MRLLPLGDPHLERRPLDDIPPLDVESFDVLVAAGRSLGGATGEGRSECGRDRARQAFDHGSR